MLDHDRWCVFYSDATSCCPVLRSKWDDKGNEHAETDIKRVMYLLQCLNSRNIPEPKPTESFDGLY